KDGDIIDCEILDFNAQKGFFIKWIKNNREKSEQSSNKLQEDRGKKRKNRIEVIHSYPIKDVLNDEAVRRLYDSASE
ncbi:MAG: hypothetical protein LBF19_07295, partial [Prevotellaceae bacterium]|nr:hypothetical protein [Prevotellaceae bacterium]